MKNKIAVGILALLTACGGGGGGGSSAPTFAGSYSVLTDRVGGTCGTLAPPTLDMDHVVNQDGEKIVVNSNIVTFVGKVEDDGNGFTATAFRQVESCAVDYALGYFDRDGEGFNAAVIVNFTCPGLSCEARYAGRAFTSVN